MKGIQDQQVLITGDNGRALAGECRRHYNIVVAVTTNGGLERIGRDQDERSASNRIAPRTSTTR